MRSETCSQDTEIPLSVFEPGSRGFAAKCTTTRPMGFSELTLKLLRSIRHVQKQCLETYLNGLNQSLDVQD